MNFRDKIILKTKISNLTSKFLQNNKHFGNLYFKLYEDLIKKYMKSYLLNNIIEKKKDNECLICYKKSKFIYKTNCCNNPNICIDCFSNIMTTNCKCIYCRKSLKSKMLNDINRNIYTKIYNDKKIQKKISLRKKK